MDEEEKPFHGRIIWIERELSKVGINFACGGWRDPGGLHKSGEGGEAPEVDTSFIRRFNCMWEKFNFTLFSPYCAKRKHKK